MTTTNSPPRLRREECRRTKHDSDFYDWKVLIGASDWEDHSLGKDGAERYRTHNLPANRSCPGLYELGIVVTNTNEGSKTRQHTLRNIVVVYLGQADNVRTRLQQYGRAGSHLDHGKPLTHSKKSEVPCLQTGPGLFKEIFSIGYSLVYRWAPMRDKREAENTEKKLLERFDYAWNRLGNGTCRREDIMSKLNERLTKSNAGIFSRSYQWKPPVLNRKVGIKIKINKALPLEGVDSLNNKGLLPQILKLVRYKPRSVQLDNSLYEDEKICGVAISNGYICRNKPVPGNKRCSDHKGRRITGISHVKSRNIKMPQDEPVGTLTFFNPDQEYATCAVVLGDGSVCENRPVPGRKRCELHKGQRISKTKSITGMHQLESTYDEVDICGVATDNGHVCRRRPVPGRKRCEEHKGMSATGSCTTQSWEARADRSNACGVDLNNGLVCMNSPVPGMHQLKSTYDDELDICGVATDNGHVCSRRPVPGRKRCEEHKGMSATGSCTTQSWQARADISNACGVDLNNGLVCMNSPVPGMHQLKSTYDDELDICGAATDNGHVCSRRPVPGRKRCEEHKGMRATGSCTTQSWEARADRSNACGVDLNNGLVYMNSPVPGMHQLKSTYDDELDICGAATHNGHVCRRRPVPGRKRCEEHKGMWATGSCTTQSWQMWATESCTTQSWQMWATESCTTQSWQARADISNVCGVHLNNGLVCMNSPVPGRKRCAGHKGWRV